MKLFISIMCFIFIWSGCNSRKNSKKELVIYNFFSIEDTVFDEKYQQPHLCLKNKLIEFGNVNQKEYYKIKINIPFTNTGRNVLQIFNADVSCSCLSVEYPKKPIEQKQIDTLRILIDIQKAKGYFQKNIFINSNADNDIEIIHLKGIIE